MIRQRHREPSLRWFGTHMYICMQMLVRESVEDDVPVVQEQQAGHNTSLSSFSSSSSSSSPFSSRVC